MNNNRDLMAKLGPMVNSKRILITGASSGIGLAMARQLAPTGARLILVARSEDKLLQAQEEVARHGGHADLAQNFGDIFAYPLLVRMVSVNHHLLETLDLIG